jgi:predicted ATPase/DNA-binding CsgD family transcriptional regulator
VACLPGWSGVHPEHKFVSPVICGPGTGGGAVEAEWPVGSDRSWPLGLPTALTGLVGRESEVAEIARLVADNRLVSLVGAGGVGKTRLAIEEAAAVAPRFADGVDLVDLSEVPDPALLWATVSGAVRVEERADDDLSRRLTRVLRPQNRLLVLDNCEQLLAETAAVAMQLLSGCPELWILATSREGLGVPGEVIWRVPSLTFPWPGHEPSLEEVEEFGAMALFAARARSARPGLVIGTADIAALSSICFRLDGIPLALELAAARVSALSIREIADRLDDRFMLLSRTVGAPARHQTLRASVEWSHQLLSQAEQALFRRLAVFAGGWSLSAAEEVGVGPSVGHGQVARLLAALVDKSLVQAEDSATGTRYRLLEAVKAFAYERLVVSGELEEARARHGTYFADLGEHVVSLLHGHDQDLWASRLDQDRANLRAASQWCAADPVRAVHGLRMAAGLWEYWLIRGLIEEGAAWLEDALRRASGPPGTRAAALTGLALFTSLRGEFQRGGELLAASIALYEEADDLPGQVRALAILGYWRANDGDRGGSAEALDRAILLAGLAQDRYPAAYARLMAGMAASSMADRTLAGAYATQSVALFSEIGDYRGAGYARCVVADCLSGEGVPAEALAILRTCLRVFEELLDRWGLLISTISAALAYAARGDWRQTAFALGVADSLGERIGGRPFPAVQAAIGDMAAKTAAELGSSATPPRKAGRVAGRGDCIAAALGLFPAPGPSCAQQELPLTKREHEVTELIAGGLTNRQIAERLFIAQRTVDTHVGHILAKLGCSNRSQAAVLVGSRRPRAAPT